MEMYTRTVLIVEDEPLIRLMLAEALEDEGYAVREAGTVLEAVAILGQGNIDAVITDIDMPGGLTGLDLAKLLQSYNEGIPTIVTSGGHHLSDDMLPANARFICKPYGQVSMLALLDETIRVRLDLQQVLAAKRSS